jgi:hypothetical protein
VDESVGIPRHDDVVVYQTADSLGSAFINPKEIPFATFFIAAALAGYEMVDATAASPGAAPGEDSLAGRSRCGRCKIPQVISLLGLGLALVGLVAIREPMLALLERLVRRSYGDPNSQPGEVLRVLSPIVQALPLETYLRKATILALRGLLVLLCAAAVGFAIAGGTTLPPARRRLAGRIAIAGLLRGLVTSIRILGPAAGALVALYAFSRPYRLHAVVVPV